jgi:hypothetical protein
MTTKKGLQIPFSDPYKRMENVFALNDYEAVATVRVPGLEGEYVVVIFPYSR